MKDETERTRVVLVLDLERQGLFSGAGGGI